MRPSILIVEDDEPICMLLRYNFEREGYVVNVAHDGEAAVQSLSSRPPDLILLDWMLPRLSGIEVCRIVRRNPRSRDIPIIMLSAKGEEGDKVRGFQTGADDYITKPFSVAEVMARVRGLLRRVSRNVPQDVFECAGVRLDMRAHKVTRDGRPIHLGPTEFRMLQFLMSHPDHVFSRDEVLTNVWGHDIFVEPRTVDVHVRRLRKALNADGEDDLIRTVRGAGYAFNVAGT